MKRVLAFAVAASSALCSLSASAQEPAPAPAAPAPAPEPLPQPAPAAPVTITYTMPPASTPAPVTVDQPAPSAPRSGTPRYDLIRVGAGMRFDYVGGAGFDTFADSNLLTNITLDGTYPVLVQGKIAIGAGLGYTFGARNDDLRGMKTRLSVHRLQVPIEGRYHFVPGIYGFAKAAPGAVGMIASMQDPSSPNTLRDTGWAFSVDASVGAGILLGPRTYTAEGGTGPNADREKRTFRIWAIPEIGYGFTTKGNLDLRPDREAKDALGSDERTSVSPVGLTAFFWRLSVAATF